MKKLFGLIVFGFIITFHCFSQVGADTASLGFQFDTVYLPPDTLVQTQTKIVYVEEEYEMDLLLGVCYSSAYTVWDAKHEPLSSKHSTSNGIGLSLKSQFDQYYIRVGATVDLYSRDFLHRWTDSVAHTEYQTVLDTFDIVSIIEGKDTVEKYLVNEVLDSAKTYTRVDSSFEHVNKYTCITLPFSAGYSLGRGNFVFNIGVGCAAHFLVATHDNYSLANGFVRPESDFLNSFFFSVFSEIGADFYVSDRFAVTLSSYYSRTFPGMYHAGNVKLNCQSLGGYISFQIIF